MGWKSLIFANPDGDKGKKKEKESTEGAQNSFKSKFPSSGPIQETKTVTPAPAVQTAPAITPNNPACAPHLDKIMNMYEKGFEGLNLEGFDFFEFFKMVVEGGVDNPAMYNMAFTAAKSMGSTKESLLEQSNFYITEIQKVHNNYVAAGDKKRQEAITSKTTEETSLKTELIGIDTELERLTDLKKQKETALRDIDKKYEPTITEVECKLMANDMAMEGIVGSIQKVVTGINNNI